MRLLALCASVLIAVGLVIWFYAFRDRSGTPESGIEVAAVDLRQQLRLRGEQIPDPPPLEGTIPLIPTSQVMLSIVLPVGSEEGRYNVQILDQDKSLRFAGQGEAVFEDQKLVLRVGADLRELQPDRYFLGIRKPEFRWAYYRVRAQ